MALSVYQDLWMDPDVTALGLRLTPSADLDTVVREVEATTSASTAFDRAPQPGAAQ